MEWITESVFDNFTIEVDMYAKHLSYVLRELDMQDKKIREEFDSIQGDFDPEYTDEATVWEKATENILGARTWFIPEFQKVGAIAGYCIILFHLFERFLEEISYLKDGDRVPSYLDFKTKYPAFASNPSFDKLDELRLIANYCKHGKGSAETGLTAKRPDYFEPFGNKLVPKPLSGYDIKISQDDFNKYVAAIKDFVNAVKEAWG
jgi:hypothetical protein